MCLYRYTKQHQTLAFGTVTSMYLIVAACSTQSLPLLLCVPPLFFFFFFVACASRSALKAQLPMLSTGARASTPLKAQADGIRLKLSELGEDAAEVSRHAPAPPPPSTMIILRISLWICFCLVWFNFCAFTFSVKTIVLSHRDGRRRERGGGVRACFLAHVLNALAEIQLYIAGVLITAVREITRKS